MASDVDDLSVEYVEDGVKLVRELDKVVLTKGAWATLLFRYQDLDRKTGEYGKDKFTIRRFQKRGGTYIPKSKFNISSRDQARKIIDALEQWMQDPE